MGNSRWSGSLISGGGIYAAGTTYYKTQKGSAATVLPDGAVISSTYLESGSYVESTTYVKAGTGYVSGKGDYKQYAAGTVIGTGGASQAIVATGLTTIHHVWVIPRKSVYSTATTGLQIQRPCLAAGTPGSFYPTAYKLSQGAANWALNDVSATRSWFALGAKTI